MRLLLIILVLTAFSCSPQKRMNRLIRKQEKLIKKNPELKVIDTITVHDTLFLTEEKVDTIFLRSTARDTLYIQEGRSEVKYYYNYETDSVYIQGRCRDSIITREIRVPHDRVVYKNMSWKEYPWYVKAGSIAGAILFMLLILFIIWLSKK